MFVPYCTRERVARAASITAPAWLDAEIDEAIEQASRAVDRLVRRGDDARPAFAPWSGTIEFDWPSITNDSTHRFWLGPHSLLTIAAVTSGGENITADCFGAPPQYGAPYDALDVDQSTSAVFTLDGGIGQRSLSVNGVWCATPIDEQSGWTLNTTIAADDTTAEILGGRTLGVGSLLRIGTERLIVTDRSWVTTADTVTLTASMADQSVAVSSGTAYARGDSLLLNAERMVVRDIAGNTLTVQRATDGSALASHSSATVYALRNCTLSRAALGTTAASHSSGATVYVYRYPAIVEQLAVAYALDQRARETAGYGSGGEHSRSQDFNQESIEDRVLRAYGRVMFGSV